MLVFAGSNIPGKPHKLLKGFGRVALEPGEEKACTVTIKKEDLRLFDKAADAMRIPEDITIYIGRNAEDAENTAVSPERETE